MKTPFFLAATLITTTSVAISQPAQAAKVFKDASGKVYIEDNFTAKQKISIDLNSIPLTKKSIVNNCGIVVIPRPSTTIAMPNSIVSRTNANNNPDFVETANIPDVSGFPIYPLPKCRPNPTTGEYSINNELPGVVRTLAGQLAMPEKLPGSEWITTYTGLFKKKSLTADLCGLVKFGTTAKPALVTFAYEGTTYTTASLPIDIPARCIEGVKYVPIP
jgi:hypothetical protein